VIHLGSMGIVALGSLLGMICPLTVLEDALRQAGPPQSGFIQRWVSRLLYYDFPPSVFTTAYVLFALVVLITFIYIEPDRKAGAPKPQP